MQDGLSTQMLATQEGGRSRGKGEDRCQVPKCEMNELPIMG